MRNPVWKALLITAVSAGMAPAQELTFSKTELSTGASFFGTTQGVAVADLNGDGKPDLVLLTTGGPSNPQIVVVRLGNGDGTFQPGKVYPEGGTGPQMIVIGDFNGDGIPDIAIPNSAGDISLFIGNGDGTFQTVPRVPVGDTCGWMAVGDFNNDGILDLAMAFPFSARVGVMLGNGDGTFKSPVFYPVGIQPSWIAAVDMNHDGKLDLVTANSGPHTVSILLGNGNGTFGSAASYVAGQGAVSAVIGDLNGDGNPDIAIAGGPAGGIGILLGRGDGTFQPLTLYTVGTSPSSIVMADFELDGKMDLAVADAKPPTEANGVAIMRGNGDGTFQKTPLYFDVISPVELAVADFNLDGKPDLAVTNVFGDNEVDVAVLINTTSSVTSVSAASFQSGPVAPDMIVAGFGSHLATVTQGASLPLTTDLGNTTVKIKDSAGVQQLCEEYFVSSAQVNYYLPGTTAIGLAFVTVTASDGTVSTGTVEVAPVAPGLFTLNATGLAAALVLRVKPDGAQDIEQVYQLDSSKNVIPLPIDLGAETDRVYLELFGTGIQHRSALSNVSVTLAGQTLPVVPVLYAGPQGTFVGEDQVNIGPLPRTLIGSGSVNLVLTVDQVNANTVNVTIQ